MPNLPAVALDLDKSGNTFQGMRVYLGPSLGWVQTRIQPQFTITVTGTYTLTSDVGVVLVNVNAPVTINLPDVTQWLNETAYMPSTAFERAIWVKDIGAHAQANNITIVPFGAQLIDGLSQFTIASNRALIRLYPLADLSGWFVG